MKVCCSYCYLNKRDIWCCSSVLLLYINMYIAAAYSDDKTIDYVTFSRMNTRNAISSGKSFLSCSDYKQVDGTSECDSHSHTKGIPRVF
jgi:hypothetical protein